MPAEISPQERPALPSQRFPVNADSGPLNSSSAQAYRPAMSRLVNQLSPNPRLQRTRAALLLQSTHGKIPSSSGVMRAPLNRKPLAAGRSSRA